MADVVRMYDKAAAHSPKVKVVLYETWARHISRKGVYPFQFVSQQDFQRQLHENYYSAAAKLNSEKGKDIATVAPCGDAWQLLHFDRSLYTGDLYHGSNEGYLLNAMVIFRTIYGGKVSGVKLDNLFSKLKIDPARGKQLAAVADGMQIK